MGDETGSLREGHVEEGINYALLEGLQEKNFLQVEGSNDCCQIHQENLIYRVPPLLRRGNESAFDPHIVSIGPYHRDMRCVQAMKAHKKRYLNYLLKRKPPSDTLFEELTNMLAGIEEKARRCYSENISLNKTEFVEMMCLDGCFIVELFLKIIEKKNDELLTGPMWRPRNILSDMLLLENQLPFFVLEEIFMFIKPYGEGTNPTKLLEHCLQIFEKYKEWRNTQIPTTEDKDIFHLLHLFHKHILPCPKPKQSNSQDGSSKSNDLPLFYRKNNSRVKSTIQIISNTHANSMPCATGLVENRVNFKKKKGRGSFLEISFKNRVLEIPYLWVDDHTESMFRNFIAFEQCSLNTYIHRHQFSAYVKLMDSIVNTEKDVEVLRRARIMEHGLGSDKDVALFFNRLNKGVIVNLNDSYLSDVFNSVDEHCKKFWNMWFADLKHRYFTTPWTCLALAAAVFGLLITILTAIMNVSNYFWLRTH